MPFDPQDHENKRHHLSMIQATIIRMAANAFLLKGWSVTLIVGLFALTTKDGAHQVLKVGYLPTLVFLFLNGYYLDQERRFRNLYDHVRLLPPDQIDFSLNTQTAVAQTTGALGAAFSKTLIFFYGAILLSIFCADAYLNGSPLLRALCTLGQ